MLDFRTEKIHSKSNPSNAGTEHIRPHSSLGYRSPAPEAIVWPSQNGPASTPVVALQTKSPLTLNPDHPLGAGQLSGHLGGKVHLYAKRDDCNSGLAFGGNKLRKLEYIIPDAIASGADTLVSIGGVQSNHTRMVAAVAAKIGFKCRLVQES
jgi:hypothetical protein